MGRPESIVGALIASLRSLVSGYEAPGEQLAEERRRTPRVALGGGNRPYLLVDGTRLRLREISAQGFALDVAGPNALPESTFAATLIIGEEEIEMRVRVIHRRGQRVGCEIDESDPVWPETAHRVLDPLLLGRQLREIDPRFVAPDGDKDVRWFQGGPACDLFLWHDPGGAFVAAQLFFMGQVIEWSPDHGVRTGSLDGAGHGGHGYAVAQLFHLTSPPDEDTVAVARRILGAASLPDEVRELLEGSVREAPSS